MTDALTEEFATLVPSRADLEECDPRAGVSPDVGRHGEQSNGRLARNLSALAGGQMVTWTMTLAWTLVVPRLLGPDGLGMITAALAITGIFTIVVGLGTTTYIAREMVLDLPRAPQILGSALVLRLLSSPLLFVAAFTVVKLGGYRPEAAIVLYLATAMTVLLLLTDIMQSYFQAVERMHYLALGGVVNKVAQSLGGIAVVAVGFGATGVGAVMLAAGAAVLVLDVMWLRRYVSIDPRTNVRKLIDMARASMGFWPLGLALTIYTWVDTAMLSTMAPVRVVGWYGASVTLYQTLSFIPGLFSTAWLPRLVGAFGRGQGELARIARRPTEIMLLISLPISAGLGMAAGAIVTVLYGSAYAHAVPATMILALCLPATYLNMIIGNVFIAGGRQRIWSLVMVGALVVNVIANAFVIPLTQHHFGNGAVGAAGCLLLTEILITIAGLALLGSTALDRSGFRRCLRAALASGAMWAAAAAAHPLGPVIAIVTGVTTLLVLTLGLRIVTAEEAALMRSGLARVRRRSVR